MTFIEWLEQSWVIIVAIIGGITLIWNFYSKVLKEVKTDIKKPLTNLSAKIEELQKQIKQIEENDNKIKKSLLSMQRSLILARCEERMKAGFATLEHKQTISAQFESYKELGGNSFISEMVAKVLELPLTEKE